MTSTIQPAPPTVARSRARWLAALRWTLAALVALAFAWFVRGLDFAALGRALYRSAPLPVAAATALNFLHMFWKSLRFKMMLQRTKDVPILRMFRYTVANYAASVLLPARLGEVVRVFLLRRREGVPVETSAAVALGEKLLEALAMLAVVAPLPWLLPLPPTVGRTIAFVALGGAALFVVALIVLRHGKPGTRLRRFLDGIEVLGRPGALAATLAVSVLAWLTDVIEVLLILHALDIAVPWSAALLILLGVNIAVALPSTPGNVGAFELGIVVALDIIGVPREGALAFALIYHGMQVVPLALIGLAELRLLREVRAASRADTPIPPPADAPPPASKPPVP